MRRAPDRFVTRRQSLRWVGLGAALAVAAAARAVPVRPVVTVLGDSITAGLGLPAAQALPEQLAAALARLGAPADVRGAGVSGDTSADGLARLDFSVRPDTAVCLVALGGNDVLQGLDPGQLRANLDAIVRRLKRRRIGVVLAGLAVPPAVGAGYARDVRAVFASVAREERVPLYPNLLAGVGPEQRQADGLHPNAAGVRVMALGLAPLVARALRRRG